MEIIWQRLQCFDPEESILSRGWDTKTKFPKSMMSQSLVRNAGNAFSGILDERESSFGLEAVQSNCPHQESLGTLVRSLPHLKYSESHSVAADKFCHGTKTLFAPSQEMFGNVVTRMCCS